MPARPSDLELLERWSDGDRAAGDHLVLRYFARVRGYFIGKFAEDYEDLTQETFSRLCTSRDRVRDTFKAFLFGTARNVGREHLRRRYKLDASLDAVSLADVTGRQHSSVLAEREQHRLLLDALRRLSIAQQELVELRYFQQLTWAELEELYDKPESTVRGRLRRALVQLARHYHELAGQRHTRDLEQDDVTRWLEELGAELGRAVARP
jgi:RNA polymerase sigma factor (sigma-70 family)